jgi:hypothetical protein
MRDYESHHGVGRSGGGSVSSVFRKSAPDYAQGQGPRQGQAPRQGQGYHGQGSHNPHPQNEYDHPRGGSRTQTQHEQQQQHRDHRHPSSHHPNASRNERNAPSPSDCMEGEPVARSSRGMASHQGGRMVASVSHGQTPVRHSTSTSMADLPEDSPQRILLSMRTPSVGAGHSFDRSKSSSEDDAKMGVGGSGSNKAKLDIQSPPELMKRNNHNTSSGFAENFFSDPSSGGGGPGQGHDPSLKSPMRQLSSVPSNLHYTNSSGERFEIAPSFSLFNPASFDSLGDCPQVQKNRAGGGDISLAALGSMTNTTNGSPSKLGGGAGAAGAGDLSVSGNPSFGALGMNMSLGLGTQTMNMSRSGSMGLLFSLSGAAPSFGGDRSPNHVSAAAADTHRRNDTTILDTGMDHPAPVQRASSRGYSSCQQQQLHQREQDIIRYDSSKPPPVKASRSSRSHHSSHSAPSAQRNNSYGSQNSNGTNSSGPHIFYANICITPNAASMPGFYHMLIHMRHAFSNLTFLLPGLKMALNRDQHKLKINVVYDPDAAGTVLPDGTRCSKDAPKLLPLKKEELKMARRRVVSAVCAFGGTDVKPVTDTEEEENDEENNHHYSSSSSSSSKRQKMSYDDLLASRYYENSEENRLSWDFEETPPVISAAEEEMMKKQLQEHQANGGSDSSPKTSSPSKEAKPGSSPSSSPRKESPAKTGQPKMRYRCKLCGQPKQNHVCPYQSSLQRSIGITIYPALNAFTADEPGNLAPPLTDMNNFVSEDGSPERPEKDWTNSPTTPTPEKRPGTAPLSSSSSSPFHNQPGSSVPPPGGVFRGVKTNISTPFGAVSSIPPGSSSESPPYKMRPLKSVPRKRHVGQVSRSSSNEEMLFVESMELKPEQFRVLTARPAKGSTTPDDADNCKALGPYCYPQLPLPYTQRKGLSDTLFSLSKEVQHLTDECASILKEAREKDMWDLAVAELMTQVTAVLHCPLGDNNFDGVRQYLLTLGIAC